ncbi:MAG: HD domain-containing protein [Bdellovibrionota bacterium]
MLREAGALEKLFPEVAGMSGVDQPREYHIADVFDHTMMALDAAAADPLVQHPGDAEVMLGILYHDVGKPACAGRHPEDGRITFYGHQSVSEEKARERLTHWRSPMIGAEPENVARLAARHMFDTRADSTGRALRRFIRAVGVELVGKLLDVALCDRRAQRDPSRVDDLLALRERIEMELSAKPPLSVKDLAISGRDLLERGYKPGPALGNELARLLELVIEEPARNTREFLLENLSPPAGQAD